MVKGLMVCDSLRSEQSSGNISGTRHEKPGAPRNEAGPDITRAIPWISPNGKSAKAQTPFSSSAVSTQNLVGNNQDKRSHLSLFPTSKSEVLKKAKNSS